MPAKVDPIAAAWAKTHKVELPQKLQCAPTSLAGLANAATGKHRKGTTIRVKP